LVQRITAVLLVVVLGTHLWLGNFGQASPSLSAFVGILLLALALFHGLNGLRTVILDYDVGTQGRKFAVTVLLLLAALVLLFGVQGLWPLIAPG
jgi:succinate dehydrogenase hydrophobic anchor subunit